MPWGYGDMMNLKLKDSARTFKTKVFLALLATLGGFLCAIFAHLGIFAIPLTASFIATLFLAERGDKPVFSVIVPIIVFLLDFVFNSIYSLCGVCSIIIALLIYLSLTRKIFSKGECAIAVTAVIAIAMGAMMLLYAFLKINSFDYNLAVEYYQGLLTGAKESAISSMMTAIESSADNSLAGITAQDLSKMFDSYFSMLLSMIVVLAFLICGLTFKFFGYLSSKYVMHPEVIQRWRFSLSPIYCYFYLALYFISSVVTGNGVFTIAVLNMANVFMSIFAYLGFEFALKLVERKINSKFVSVFILFILFILLGSFAISILSFAGVFSIIIFDKAKKESESDSENKS